MQACVMMETDGFQPTQERKDAHEVSKAAYPDAVHHSDNLYDDRMRSR